MRVSVLLAVVCLSLNAASVGCAKYERDDLGTGV